MAEEPETQESGMPRSPFPERRLPSPPEDIPMDVELLKVLASDSRRDILQHLKKRRMTLTELAHALNLKKATVLEHLKKLTDAGLIRRLEDERLWVYYELTHRGGRIVSPQRTRFYLLMGVSAAALVVGALAVALLASNLGPGLSADEGTRASGGLASDAPKATGGAGVSVDLALDGDAQKTRAYLLTADDADQLRREGGAVAGIPLALDEAGGDVARFRSLSAVPPGSYYLYVVDEEGRDNLDTLSEIRVPSLETQGPDVLWRGLSGASQFTVRRDGAPAEGTLLLAAGDGHELPTLPLHEGVATLDPETLDRLVPTRYQVQYLPNGTQYWIMTDRAVEVREPLLAVEPLYALEGVPTRFQVALAPGGTRVDLLPPPVVPGVEPHGWSREPDGSGVEATFTFATAGAKPMSVGRLDPVEVEVLPDVRIALDEADGQVTLATRDADGAPVAEVAVGLGARTLDLTDANGTVAFAPPEPGAYELRLTLPHGAFVARGLHYDGENWTEETPQVRVRDTTAELTPAGVRATGVLLNEGVAAQKVTLSLQVNGRTVATSAVASAPASGVNVTLTAPLRLPAGEHAIRLVATPLRQTPMAGAPQLGEWAVDDGPAAAPAPAFTNTTAYDAASARSEDVVLRVRPAESPQPEKVVLQPRALSEPSATSADGAPDERAAAETPAPGALAVALAAVALALLLRRGPRRPRTRPG